MEYIRLGYLEKHKEIEDYENALFDKAQNYVFGMEKEELKVAFFCGFFKLLGLLALESLESRNLWKSISP